MAKLTSEKQRALNSIFCCKITRVSYGGRNFTIVDIELTVDGINVLGEYLNLKNGNNEVESGVTLQNYLPVRSILLLVHAEGAGSKKIFAEAADSDTIDT